MTALPIENSPARRRRRRPARSGPPPAGRQPASQPPQDHEPQRQARVTGEARGLAGTATLNASFADLGVPGPLVEVLAGTGITAPFPIQAATLPDALAGRDILGRGRTGSGKTLGFSLPLVAGLTDGYTSAGRPRGLVLVPTRELASQVQAVLVPLAQAMDLTVATIFGGTGQNAQVKALRNRVDIVVACPGRLADLIEQGHCHLGDVEISVLDEADHMADLGFLPVVRRLMEATPPESQRMLFSATLDNAVDVLVRRFLSDPAVHSVDSVTAAPGAMVHHLLTVAPGDRVGVVAALAGGNNRSLVFTRTKHGAQKLTRQLAREGVSVVELHGNLGQGARERNLASFSAWLRPGPGGHGHRRPRHSCGRHRPGHPRRPACRAQGLPAPVRPDRPGRRGRRGDHRAEPGPGRRRAGADAPRGREPAGGQRQPRLSPGALYRRAAGRPGRAPRTTRRRGNGSADQPGHRPWRGGHVGRLTGGAAGGKHRCPQGSLADAGTGRRRGNTLASRRR